MSASIATKRKNLSQEFLKKTAKYVVGATGDYFSEAMPVTGSTISGAKETARELQSTFTTTASSINQKIRSINRQQTFKKITDWYLQKENEFDVDGDFDSSLDFDTDTDSGNIAQASITEWGKNANQISKTVVESSHKMVEAQVSATANLVSATDRQTAVISSGFDKTNQTLSKILEVLTKNTSTMIESMAATEEREAKNNLIGGKLGKGWLNDYKKMVKGNIANSEAGSYASMAGMIPMILQYSSPQDFIKMGIDWGVGKKAPNTKKNMEALDQAVGEVVMGSLLRLGEQRGRGGITGTLAEIFGIKSDREKASTKTSTLEMKSVPFDTVTKEAITQAIPGYLRQILVQLGGKDLTYDFRSRQFKSAGAIKRDFEDKTAGTYTSWGAGKNAKKYLDRMKGNNDQMLFDMMVAEMGWSEEGTGGVKAARGLQGMSRAQIQTYLAKLAQGLHGTVDVGNMVEILVGIAGDKLAANDIAAIVAKENQASNQRASKEATKASIMGDKLDHVNHSLEGDIAAIARAFGRQAQSDVKTKQSQGALFGVEYTNRALYAIFNRLNTGINVYQTGSDTSRDKPYEPIPAKELPPPQGVQQTRIDNLQAARNRRTVGKVLFGRADPITGEDGQPATVGKRVSERGKDLGKAILFGGPDDVRAAFGSLVGDIGGYVKDKLIGSGKVDEGKALLSKFTDPINEFFKGKKGADGTQQVPNLIDFLFKGKRDGMSAEDITKRKKITGAMIGATAMTGLGILAGPFGLLMGGLVGSAVSTSSMGGKIKTMIMGDGDQKKGAFGHVKGFFKRMLGWDKPQTEEALAKRKRTQVFGALGGLMTGSTLGLIGGPVTMILAGLAGAAISTSGLGGKILDSVLGSKNEKGDRVGGLIHKVMLPVGRALGGLGKLLLSPLKLIASSVAGTAKAVSAVILKPLANIGHGIGRMLFGHKDPKTGEKVPGLLRTAFSALITTPLKAVSNTLKNIGSTIRDRILDPISDVFFVLKERMKRSVGNILLGKYDEKTGKYSGGLFGFGHLANVGKSATNFFKDKVTGFVTKSFDLMGSAVKTAVSSPFAILRMLNPFSQENVWTKDGRSRIGDKLLGTKNEDGTRTGGFLGGKGIRERMRNLAGGMMSVGTSIQGRDGDGAADYLAGDREDIRTALEKRRATRKKRRYRSDDNIKYAEATTEAVEELTDAVVEGQEKSATLQEQSTSYLKDLHEAGIIKQNSIAVVDNHAAERDEEKMGLLRGILSQLGGGEGEKSPTKGKFRRLKKKAPGASISGEEESSGDNTIAGSVLGSISTSTMASGGLSKREETEQRRVFRFLKKKSPEDAPAIDAAEKVSLMQRETSEGKGGAEKSPLMKLFDTVTGFLGPIASFGMKNPIIAGIAGFLGFNEVKSLWSKVFGKDKDEDLGFLGNLKKWWEEDSTIGQGFRGLMDIYKFISPIAVDLTNKASGMVSGVTGFLHSIPGIGNLIPSISPPQIDGSKPFAGLAASALGGLYLKILHGAVTGITGIANFLKPSGGVNLPGGAGKAQILAPLLATVAGTTALGAASYGMHNDAYMDNTNSTIIQDQVSGEEKRVVDGESFNQKSNLEHAGTNLADPRMLASNALGQTAFQFGRTGLQMTASSALSRFTASRFGNAVAQQVVHGGGLQGAFNAGRTALTRGGFSALRSAGTGTMGQAMTGGFLKSGAQIAGNTLKNIFTPAGLASMGGGMASSAAAGFGWDMADNAGRSRVSGDYGTGFNAGNFVGNNAGARWGTTTAIGIAGGIAIGSAWSATGLIAGIGAANGWNPVGWALLVTAGVIALALGLGALISAICRWFTEKSDEDSAVRTNSTKFAAVKSGDVKYIEGSRNAIYVHNAKDSDKVCGLTAGLNYSHPEVIVGAILHNIVNKAKESPGGEVLLYDLINNMAYQGVPFACYLAGDSKTVGTGGKNFNKEVLGDPPKNSGNKTQVFQSSAKNTKVAMMDDINSNINRLAPGNEFDIDEDLKVAYEAGKKVHDALLTKGVLKSNGKIDTNRFKNAPGSKKDCQGWKDLEDLGRAHGVYFIHQCLVFINSKIDVNKKNQQWMEYNTENVAAMMENVKDLVIKEAEASRAALKKEGFSDEEIDKQFQEASSTPATPPTEPTKAESLISNTAGINGLVGEDQSKAMKSLRYLDATYLFSHPDKLHDYVKNHPQLKKKDHVDQITNWENAYKSNSQNKRDLRSLMVQASLQHADENPDLYHILGAFNWDRIINGQRDKVKDLKNSWLAPLTGQNKASEDTEIYKAWDALQSDPTKKTPKDLHKILFGDKEHDKKGESSSLPKKADDAGKLGVVSEYITKYPSDEGRAKGSSWEDVLKGIRNPQIGGPGTIAPMGGPVEELDASPSGESQGVSGLLPSPFAKSGFRVTSHHAARNPSRPDHTGIDLVPQGGENDWSILAQTPGTITRIDRNIRGFVSNSYGNLVQYRTPGNDYYSYNHMAYGTIPDSLRVGDTVQPGDYLGKMGNTGTSYGSHLHFEIRQGSISARGKDPYPYLSGASMIENSGRFNASSGDVGAYDGDPEAPPGESGGILSQIFNALKKIGAAILNFLFGGLYSQDGSGKEPGDKETNNNGWNSGDLSGNSSGVFGALTGAVKMVANYSELKNLAGGDHRRPVELLDLQTGKSYMISWACSSGYHTDWTPMSPADVKICWETIKGANAGSPSGTPGSWSWKARPGILKLGDKMVACGFHTYPHHNIMGGSPGFPFKNAGGTSFGSSSPIGGHMCMYYGYQTGGKMNDTCNEQARRAYEEGNKLFEEQQKAQQSTIAGAAGANSGNLTSGSRPIPLNERSGQVFSYLLSKGFTPEAAAGVLGNLYAETTTINTNTVNKGDGSDGSDSIGIIQWNSSRAQALKSFASQRGKSVNDLQTQLDFMIQEMPSQADNRFRNPNDMRLASSKGVYGQPGVDGTSGFMKMTNAAMAARFFDGAYVRSGGNANDRANWANEYLQLSKASIPTVPSTLALNSGTSYGVYGPSPEIGGPFTKATISNIRARQSLSNIGGPDTTISELPYSRNVSPAIPARIPQTVQRQFGGSGYRTQVGSFPQREEIQGVTTSQYDSSYIFELMYRELCKITGNTAESSDFLDIISHKEFGVDSELREGISKMADASQRRPQFPQNINNTQRIRDMIRG